ncbi:substrate-binding periplasmic protein [Pseudomonas vanderleydeniana]|uniref:ABC transporter substrate-binding protein n=1 Tax=Pseudomonas vanderleydeniana TaxID=2745495 RepID=A0A9E6TQ86_9PSED|nr:ABC transporter substrate-binding protein [Pseudomonas vanderleydeniana]QXI26187.1 ABC transporter substrate-binding protein [Pseudomonas vanderleydeniana]
MKYPVLIAALFCLFVGNSARAERYELVTEEWAPYNYLENNQLTGMATEIVHGIMARTGDQFRVTMVPSMRATLSLQHQPRTIMFSLFRTPEREALYKWVGPIAEESIHAYQLATTRQPVDTLEQLKQAPRVTTRHAGLIPDKLEAQGFPNLEKSATGSLQLYRMLLAGRTEIVVGDTDAGVAYYCRQLNIPPGALRQIPVELYHASLYIAFSLDSDDKVVASWTHALEQMRQSGELERIQNRYTEPAWQ